MGTYSFLDTNATMAGPTGFVNLGAGAAVAEEGIVIEPAEDKNVMTVGADGKGQHSLIASDAAKLTVNLLKTSPTNKALMLMYDAQSAASVLWGKNIFTITNTGLGDYTVATSAAFKKKPTIKYDKVGEMMSWEFDCIVANTILGAS